MTNSREKLIEQLKDINFIGINVEYGVIADFILARDKEISEEDIENIIKAHTKGMAERQYGDGKHHCYVCREDLARAIRSFMVKGGKMIDSCQNLFSQDELKVMQNSLVCEFEVKQGIKWKHHGVYIQELVVKLDAMLPKERRYHQNE